MKRAGRIDLAPGSSQTHGLLCQWPNTLHLFDLAALIISAAALLAYINYQFLKLPMTIGIMALSLVASMAMVLAGRFGLIAGLDVYVADILRQIDFNQTLMHGMLSFLLFAGALHVDLAELRQRLPIIVSMATVGTIGSTFLIGGVTWLLLGLLSIELSFAYCLVFGALISPTDPIAVIGILRVAGVPKSLEIKIVGESLFNDGVAVVLFLVLLGVATGAFEPTASGVSILLLEEAGGGIGFGLVLGFVGILLLRSIDNYSVEALITLAIVMGGYAASFALHVSGPLAMVVAGLIIGNHGRKWAMSDTTRAHLDTFWELIDEVLNAVLFMLIGLELLVLTFRLEVAVAGLVMIPLVLAIRFFCVGVPFSVLRLFDTATTHAIKILTWAGLRGGISVALALSLPLGESRDTILLMTYLIVAFSIIVQGLTTGRVIAGLNPQSPVGGKGF